MRRFYENVSEGVIQGFIAQINTIQDTIWKSQHLMKNKKHLCWTFETIYTSAKLLSLIYTPHMKAIKDRLSLLSPKSGQSKETN